MNSDSIINIHDQQNTSDKKRNNKTKEDNKRSLETLIPISKLNQLRTLLVTTGVLTPHTFQWKDISKGYKGCVSAFIHVLQIKGYFGNEHFFGEQVAEIAKNSFNISMDAKTANEGIKNSVLINKYSFILLFSQLP